jgi:hypothetical protein
MHTAAPILWSALATTTEATEMKSAPIRQFLGKLEYRLNGGSIDTYYMDYPQLKEFKAHTQA